MTGTLFVRVDGISCGASMVKISVDCPGEAPRCQRISSTALQISFDGVKLLTPGRLFFGAAFREALNIATQDRVARSLPSSTKYAK